MVVALQGSLVAGVGHGDAAAPDLLCPIQLAEAVFTQAHPVPAEGRGGSAGSAPSPGSSRLSALLCTPRLPSCSLIRKLSLSLSRPLSSGISASISAARLSSHAAGSASLSDSLRHRGRGGRDSRRPCSASFPAPGTLPGCRYRQLDGCSTSCGVSPRPRICLSVPKTSPLQKLQRARPGKPSPLILRGGHRGCTKSVCRTRAQGPPGPGSGRGWCQIPGRKEVGQEGMGGGGWTGSKTLPNPPTPLHPTAPHPAPTQAHH